MIVLELDSLTGRAWRGVREPVNRVRHAFGFALGLILLLAFPVAPSQAGNAGYARGDVTTSSGSVIMWGSNQDRESTVPAKALNGATAIAAGVRHALALKNGRVIAWGFMADGRGAVPVEAQSGVTSIAAGYVHSLALDRFGRVIAWGDNAFGRATVPVDAQSGVSSIAAGAEHSLALKNGRVIAWGSDRWGQVAVPTEAQSGVAAIAAGLGHSLAVKDGKVIAWGLNSSGQAIVPIEAQSGVTSVAAGTEHSLALKDGRVIAWGSNSVGQVDVPTEALSGVTAIAAGFAHSLALKEGRVIAWGANFSGQVDVPTEALSGVTAIASGWANSMALRAIQSAPGSPEGVSAVPGDRSAVVTWSVSAESAPATSTIVSASPGGAQCIAQSWATSCRVSGLRNGTGYTFTVIARNDFGASSPSPPSARIIPQGAPTPPQSVVGKPGDGRVRIMWRPPRNNGGTRIIEYVAVSTPGNRTCSSRSANFCVISGLSNGTPYTFSVIALNRLGSSRASAESRAVTPRPARQ
jgi:hypothetical protein